MLFSWVGIDSYWMERELAVVWIWSCGRVVISCKRLLDV